MALTSIIVPTLNEETHIAKTLSALAQLHGEKEVLVADGGSEDATVERATACGARVLRCPRGRGSQMHAAVRNSRGDVLWFLHADTVPPPQALECMRRALAESDVVGGTFALEFSGRSFAARQMTWIYPRLRMLGLSYGDSGLFIRRSVYDRIGGYGPYALFEDLDLVRHTKRCGRFVFLDCPLVTSSRRFENGNYASAWAVWITLQLLYWLGVSPNRLARWYHHAR